MILVEVPKATVRAEERVPLISINSNVELIRHPEVGMVSVVVKAPEHRGLILAAVEAGKPVFCEWSLGISLSEMDELAKTAARRNVKTAIDLQGRYSPWLNHVRAFLRDGLRGPDPLNHPLCRRRLFDQQSFGRHF